MNGRWCVGCKGTASRQNCWMLVERRKKKGGKPFVERCFGNLGREGKREVGDPIRIQGKLDLERGILRARINGKKENETFCEGGEISGVRTGEGYGLLRHNGV